MGLRLTDRVVASLTCPPGSKDALFFDGVLKGFALRATASGNKFFLYCNTGAVECAGDCLWASSPQ
jgi:hypothetical protein